MAGGGAEDTNHPWPYYCNVCDAWLIDDLAMLEHLQGGEYRMWLAEHSKVPVPLQLTISHSGNNLLCQFYNLNGDLLLYLPEAPLSAQLRSIRDNVRNILAAPIGKR